VNVELVLLSWSVKRAVMVFEHDKVVLAGASACPSLL